MITILLALLFSTLIMVCFKLFERFRIDTIQAITVNYLVAVISGAITSPHSIQPQDLFAQPWFYNGMLIGSCFIIVFTIFATSAQKVGIAITAVSSKMSVVIPVLVGVLILRNDHLTVVKVAGILVALLAFYLTFKKKEKINLKKGYFLLPVLLFFGNGTNDSLMSYTNHIYHTNQQHQTTSLLIVIFSTALCLGICFTVYRAVFLKKPVQWKNIAAGIVLGLFNYLSTYYFFRSLDLYPNSVFFPVFNAGIVTLSALTGFIIFREKLRLINWIGIIAAIVAIVVIALAGVSL